MTPIPRSRIAAVLACHNRRAKTLACLDSLARQDLAADIRNLGTCVRETASGRWFDPGLPLAARWRLVTRPLGFPLRPWLSFARRHGGPLWPLFVPLPYWRLIAPLWLARRIDRRRAVGMPVLAASHA